MGTRLWLFCYSAQVKIRGPGKEREKVKDKKEEKNREKKGAV